MRAWDGVVSEDSVAATIFERFVREMARRIAVARAPNSAEWALGRGFSDLVGANMFFAGRQSRVLRRLVEQPEGWFAGGWDAEMRDALASVVRGLREEHGENPTLWRWGHVRQITLSHPLGVVKQLAPLFNRGPFPWGGDGNTVSQASGSKTPVIASLRAVMPVGDWDNARFVLPGWAVGKPVLASLRRSATAVEAGKGHADRLVGRCCQGGDGAHAAGGTAALMGSRMGRSLEETRFCARRRGWETSATVSTNR